MATSGTYTFNPTGGDLITYAFSLCGIRRPQLLAEHMVDARMAINLLLSAWGNSTPNLWTVDLQTQVLSAGTATYSVPDNTIMILDAYISTGEGEAMVDRIIWPVSRTEYASYPNKTLQAPPTVFWFDRLLSPTITLWQVPDDQQTYTLKYYRCVATQDAVVGGGVTLDLPPLWLNDLAWGLAAQLAASYAPDRAEKLDMKAQQWLTEAREQNVENVAMYVILGLNNYWPQ
jgi:hypothetical protein